jgi:hypothetical protein
MPSGDGLGIVGKLDRHAAHTPRHLLEAVFSNPFGKCFAVARWPISLGDAKCVSISLAAQVT